VRRGAEDLSVAEHGGLGGAASPASWVQRALTAALHGMRAFHCFGVNVTTRFFTGLTVRK
jgi:hypothetical protein